jgi:broad specificity phosphatase PhoE
MRLYIIRHGDPDYERDDLTQAGHREARALAELFAREGLDEVHSSSLGRARRTAGYTAEALGLPLVDEAWARELSELRDAESSLMVWDYDPNVFASMEEAERGRLFWSGAWKSLPPFDRADLGTALERVERGADDFMARQGFLRENGAYRLASPNARKVALFCHNGSGLAMIARFLGLPLPALWGSFFLHTSSVTTLLFEERRPGLATARCIGLSDLSHLRVAGLAPGGSGLKANLA